MCQWLSHSGDLSCDFSAGFSVTSSDQGCAQSSLLSNTQGIYFPMGHNLAVPNAASALYTDVICDDQAVPRVKWGKRESEWSFGWRPIAVTRGRLPVVSLTVSTFLFLVLNTFAPPKAHR